MLLKYIKTKNYFSTKYIQKVLWTFISFATFVIATEYCELLVNLSEKKKKCLKKICLKASSQNCFL